MVFSTIKGYLYTVGAAIFAGLVIAVKVLSFQKKELKRENAGHVKKNEIREDITAANKKAE
ncbi:hypothetical protein KAR91_75900, partial [Candidatus Pacearchaeota archaeon]|nr:hypothetical protein [Candidatus Pacearchaeota archaeon]